MESVTLCFIFNNVVAAAATALWPCIISQMCSGTARWRAKLLTGRSTRPCAYSWAQQHPPIMHSSCCRSSTNSSCQPLWEVMPEGQEIPYAFPVCKHSDRSWCKTIPGGCCWLIVQRCANRRGMTHSVALAGAQAGSGCTRASLA